MLLNVADIVMNPTRAKLIVFAACWFSVSTALAGQLTVKPQVTMNFGYNDNTLLQSDDENPESRTSIVGEFKLDIAQESADTAFSISPRLRRIQYPEDKFSQLNATEYLLFGDIVKQYKLLTFGSGLRATNQTILSAEDSDPEDPNPSSSGNFINPDARVENLALSPYLGWAVSRRDQVTFSSHLERVDQIRRFSSNADYAVRQAGIRYTRMLNERHFIGLNGTAGRTETYQKNQYCTINGFPEPRENCVGVFGSFTGRPGELFIVTENIRQTIETIVARLTYEYSLTSTINLKAEYGRQKTDIALHSRAARPADPGFVLTSRDKSNFDTSTYLLSINHTRPRSTWLFEVTRDLQPSVNGSPVDKTQARAAIAYEIAHKLSGKLKAIYYRQTQRSIQVQNKRNFLRAEAALSYDVNPQLSTDAVYIYRNLDRNLEAGNVLIADLSGSQRSHNVLFVLRYKF